MCPRKESPPNASPILTEAEHLIILPFDCVNTIIFRVSKTDVCGHPEKAGFESTLVAPIPGSEDRFRVSKSD